jgi:hypothetical protein
VLNQRGEEVSVPLINIENLIVPPDQSQYVTTEDAMDGLRWKPSGQIAHSRQLAALELSIKLKKEVTDGDPTARANLIHLSWWCTLLGELSYFTYKCGGTTKFFMSAGAHVHCAQTWDMTSVVVGSRTFISLVHQQPDALSEYPVNFWAGFEVRKPEFELAGLDTCLLLPTNLPAEAGVGGLWLEIIGEKEPDLIKHAIQQGTKLDKDVASKSVRHKVPELDDLKKLLPVSKSCLSRCSRLEVLLILLNVYFPGDELLARRMELLKLQKSRQMVDAKLLQILELIDGPAASKFDSLKSHLQKKSKLSDTEDDIKEFEANLETDESNAEGEPALKIAKADKKYVTPLHYKTLIPGGGTYQKLAMWARPHLPTHFTSFLARPIAPLTDSACGCLR